MEKMISNIVFTKNRPLQFEAYLESLYKCLNPEIIQTYVIYKVDLFAKEYEEIFEKYADCLVIKEDDFHSDFLKILDRVNSPYVLFGVDDVVYFNSVDFDLIDRTFLEHGSDIFGFSLRFGNDSISKTGDFISGISVAGQEVYSVNWTQGQTRDTRYPFELCATIYPAPLVKKIINGVMNGNPLSKKLFSPNSFLIKLLGKVISTRSVLKSFGYFFSPNTLESWNCRWCQNHSDEMPSQLFFQKQCAIAIQINMVNTSSANASDDVGGYTTSDLNESYQQGYRLDIDFVADKKPVGIHCGTECFKLIKR